MLHILQQMQQLPVVAVKMQYFKKELSFHSVSLAYSTIGSFTSHLFYDVERRLHEIHVYLIEILLYAK